MPRGVNSSGGIVIRQNSMDINRVFNALAKILGDRENVKIKVTSIDKKTEEETAS